MKNKDLGTDHFIGELLPFLSSDAQSIIQRQPATAATQRVDALQPGLEAVVEFPIRWVVAWSDTLRQVFAETRPSIQSAQDPKQTLDWMHGVRWASVGADVAAGTAKIVMQCSDEQSAQRVYSDLPKFSDAMYRHWIDPAETEFSFTDPGLVRSEVLGDQVIVRFGGDESGDESMVRLLRMMAVGVQRSDRYRVEQQMSKMRLGRVVIATGDGWTGDMPADLEDEFWQGAFTIAGNEPIGSEFAGLRD